MVDNRIESPLVQTSWGELIDKITILEIKSIKAKDDDALANINYELVLLREFETKILTKFLNLRDEKKKLGRVNNELWAIEDKIRQKELHKEFDSEFISLARQVYRVNDKRAAIKKKINEITLSKISEEKIYNKY